MRKWIHALFDQRDTGGSAVLVQEVEQLTKNTETLLNRIEVIEGDWKKQNAQLAEEIKTMRAQGDTIDYDRLAKEVIKIQDAQHKDEVENKLLFPKEREYIQRVPDPWKDPGSWLDDHDVKSLILERKWDGLDLAVQIPAQDDAHKFFARAAVDAMIMDQWARAATVLRGRPYNGLSSLAPNFAKRWAFYIDRYIQHITGKAAGDLMDTTDMANWVPTAWSSEMRELILLELKVAALFERIPMPTKNYELPVDLSDTMAYLAGETTSIPSQWGIDATNVQKFNPTKVTFSAKKIAGQRVMSGEFVEDAIIPVLPRVRQAMVRDLASGEEKAIIDGQATADIDTGDSPIGTNDVRDAWDGLRYYVEQYTGAKLDGATLTGKMLVSTIRKYLGEYGVDDSRLAHIPSSNCYLDMIGLDDVRTMDKLGPNATMVRGQLAQVGAAPIVPSRYVRTDLNASGIYDGVTTTKTIDIVVHRDGWMMGDRRRVTIEAVRHALDDAWQLVVMQRLSFKNLFGTSHNMAAVIYNIAS